ncbi:olfactory receptor 332 [Cricetulus griseus]
MYITTSMNNYSGQSDFTLVGFFIQSSHPALLAVVIFVVFLMALSGNGLLILLIHSDTRLHTPMYFFISQLSLMDMMYISVTVPKMLTDQVLGSHKISAAACGMQMFLYLTLVGSEFFLLAAMSYDRYVAICHPLSCRYPNLLIFLILFIYTLASAGNSILILLIWLDPRLHTPMYFLLSQLSLIDLAYISSTVPKAATNYFTGRQNISFFACATQMFSFLTLGLAECILLTLMAYGRYVAVCNPLRYTILMSPKVCLKMAASTWIGAVGAALVHTIYPMNFPICGSRKINHYFCEMPAILRMSCVDTSVYEMVKFVSTIIFLLTPFTLILTSYTLIFLTVLRMNSPKGRNKDLATCSSHLTVVSLYFGQAIFIYMTPTSSHTPDQDQVGAVLGTIVTPMLNPLIYSLRNKEVMVINFFSRKKSISRVACGTQIFFFFALGGSECLLLTLMAYDRYVAVCNPLRYSIIMNSKVCLWMALASWGGGILNSLINTIYTMHFPFCGSREIHHFFCEMPAVLKLSCEDTSLYETVVSVICIVFVLLPLGLIMSSYLLIFLAVLQMKSPEGRRKALATCSSHLAVVSLYYGPAMIIYMTPHSFHTSEQDEILSMINTIFTPMLNPLIYSLRNKEVLAALRKVVSPRFILK